MFGACSGGNPRIARSERPLHAACHLEAEESPRPLGGAWGSRGAGLAVGGTALHPRLPADFTSVREPPPDPEGVDLCGCRVLDSRSLAARAGDCCPEMERGPLSYP